MPFYCSFQAYGWQPFGLKKGQNLLNKTKIAIFYWFEKLWVAITNLNIFEKVNSA